MSTFKVGEVVIGQNFTVDSDLNGAEGQITGPLAWHMTRHPITGIEADMFGYLVTWSHRAGVTCSAPEKLRRKRPPTTGEESIIAMFHKDKQPEGEVV